MLISTHSHDILIEVHTSIMNQYCHCHCYYHSPMHSPAPNHSTDSLSRCLDNVKIDIIFYDFHICDLFCVFCEWMKEPVKSHLINVKKMVFKLQALYVLL